MGPALRDCERSVTGINPASSVIASEAKQSSTLQKNRWIASLRSQ